MSDRPQSRRLRNGALTGAYVWGAYAVAEELFAALRPLLSDAYDALPAWHWQPLLTLYAAYLLIGAGIGAAASAFLPPAPRGDSLSRTLRVRHTAVFCLALLMARGLLGVADRTAAENAALAVAVLAVLVAGAGFARPARRWIAIAGDPWVVSFLFLGAHWLGHAVLPRHGITGLLVHAAALAGLTAAAGGFALATLAWWARSARPHAGALALAGVATAAGCLAAVTPRQPMEQEIAAGRPANPMPNVVLVTLDTVRADHLSVYGYERRTTPFLEELARSATLYRRATATSNHTLPTHASLFTGLPPRSHGAHFVPGGLDEGRPLSAEALTLAEVLSEAGYRTAATVANVGYLRPEFGLHQGFERFDGTQAPPLLWWNERHHLRDRMRELIDPILSTVEFDRVTRTAPEITAHATGYVADLAPGSTPFFLFVNYMDAHAPYLPLPPFDRLFDSGPRPFTMQDYRDAIERVDAGGKMTDEERRYFTAQYDGGVAALDDALRELVGALRQAGEWRDTAFIVTADHGESFGENGVVGHGASAYQTQVFVPLIIKFPGQSEAVVVENPVSQVDIAATVFDAVGIQAPAAFGGRSLKTPDPERLAFSEAFPRSSRSSPGQLAVRARRWKLVATEGRTPQLFDLDSDPHEQSDRYREGDPEPAVLLTAMEAWLRDNPTPESSTSATPDPDTLDALRSLGYIQ